MDDEQILGTALPHSSFGAPDCCGCLNGIIRGDQADIVCNECEAPSKPFRRPIFSRLSIRWNLRLMLVAPSVPVVERCTWLQDFQT